MATLGNLSVLFLTQYLQHGDYIEYWIMELLLYLKKLIVIAIHSGDTNNEYMHCTMFRGILSPLFVLAFSVCYPYYDNYSSKITTLVCMIGILSIVDFRTIKFL